MNPFNLQSFFFSFFLVSSSRLGVMTVNADLYQLVLHSNSESALASAVADSESILQDWIDEEPTQAGLVSVLPGDAVSGGNGGVRGRNLQVNCPSRCHNSGSPMCVALGCAYCTQCRRLRLRRDLLVGRDLMGSQAGVESQLNAALSPYCDNVEEAKCGIYAKIVKVNGDGTTDELA